MAVAVETVVKQLTELGIVAPSRLGAFVPPNAQPKDGEALLSELLKQNLLTRFQAAQVAAGKAKSLILGNYMLLDKLGSGEGQVFKAEHRRLKRVVALKMLPAAMLKDATAVARFQREVEAAAKLRHTNIVAADDADEANGIHFLVTEYVDGRDLASLVNENGPLRMAKAANYIQQAARGLEYAHNQGVIHRNIKPANLLLGKDGVVKILDMGLARIETGGNEATQSELTRTGMVMGTVDFMAPEQAMSARQADARADIYSLGISLYYLIAGKVAYEGKSLMTKFLAHRDAPIPSLQAAQEAVPNELDAIFKRMVAKNVEDRYQSMAEVIRALEGLGFGGGAGAKKDAAETTLVMALSDKEKLALKTAKKPVAMQTRVEASEKPEKSEKSEHWVAKVVGGAFVTVIAPILVAVAVKLVEQPAAPSASAVEATTSKMEAASVTNLPSAPPVAAPAQAAITAEKEPPASDAASAKPSTGAPMGTLPRAVELLPLVDAARDALSGEWVLSSEGIKSDASGKKAKVWTKVLQLPYSPAQEYDFELEFTPTSGLLSLTQQLPVAGRAIAWEYDSKPPKTSQYVSGFLRLDGKLLVNSPESLKLDVPLLDNGKRYRSRIEVRSDSLRVLLDQQELYLWRGDFARFSATGQRDESADTQRPVIITTQRAITFHRITIYEVTGRGRVLTGGTTANGVP